LSEHIEQVYARALYESLVGEWQRQLSTLADQVRGVTTGDIVEQARQVEALLPATTPATLRNFLLTLVQENALRMLPEIAEAFGAVAGVGNRLVTAEIQSALALTEEQQQEIERQLISRHGRNLDIHYTVDPAILGGLIIRVGDQVIDTSVRTRLSALQRSMVAGS